ncbi:MAG: hypothetical protein FWG57_04030 [Endomicrobia bacterium]|nr:hypothetical protein [Endomicrobiia bacterium]
MKKTALFLTFFAISFVFFTACDTDDNNAYRFNGTVEIRQEPDGDTLSLSYLRANYNSKILFEATVTNSRGQEIDNPAISWGTKNVPSEAIEFVANRMAIDVDKAIYLTSTTISVQAGYQGVFSSSRTITLTY